MVLDEEALDNEDDSFEDLGDTGGNTISDDPFLLSTDSVEKERLPETNVFPCSSKAQEESISPITTTNVKRACLFMFLFIAYRRGAIHYFISQQNKKGAVGAPSMFASLLILGIDGVEFGFEGWGIFGQLLD